MADPRRLDLVESWTHDPSMWVRRAALVMTLPWAKLTHPKPDQTAERERILGWWAASYVADRDGSSRKQSRGGCATCRSMTPTAPAPFWRRMAQA